MSGANAAKLSPNGKAYIATASRASCSCAPTTPAGLRWPSDSLRLSPATVPSPGPADPNPDTRSTPPQSRPWPNEAYISNEFPKPWTDETVRAADVVITMGCGDACLIFPGKRYESWDDLDDAAGLDTPAVRPIRDDIERRARHLIDELALTPAADQRLGRR